MSSTALATSSGAQLAQFQFDTSILAGQVAPSTVAMYKRDFAAYVVFAGDFAAAMQPETLARWRTALAEGTKKSPNTINRMLSAVKRLMREAAQQGYVVPIPAGASVQEVQRAKAEANAIVEGFDTVRGVKIAAMKKRVKPHARTKITAEDMRRLCEQPDPFTPAGKMHRALLLTLATTGLRISEAVTLTMDQIHEVERKGKRGYVIDVIGKNDVETREVSLGSEAHAAIQTWLTARPVASPWIFTGFGGRGSRDPRTNHIHPVSAWELVKRYAKRAELEHVKPHDFRRFVGTKLAEDDIRKAQRQLGHKNINTTARHYVLDEVEPGLTDGLF